MGFRHEDKAQGSRVRAQGFRLKGAESYVKGLVSLKYIYSLRVKVYEYSLLS